MAHILGERSNSYLTAVLGKEQGKFALALIMVSVGSLSFAFFDWVGGAYADKKSCKAAIQLGLVFMVVVMIIFASISLFPASFRFAPEILALIGQSIVGLPLSLIDAADSQLTRKISANLGLTEREQEYVEGICTERKYSGLALASFIGCFVFIAIAEGAQTENIPLAGTAVFLLTALVQIFALIRIGQIKEPSEHPDLAAGNSTTIFDPVLSSIRSIIGEKVLMVWVLIIAVIEGWLLFSTSYFQLDALSGAINHKVNFYFLILIVPPAYGILALAASKGGRVFNWWRARAVTREDEDHVVLRRGTKLEISRRRLIAAGGILMVMLIGFVVHFLSSAPLLATFQNSPYSAYWLGVLSLVFFAFYQLLRGFAHPLLKTALGRLVAKKQVLAPTTLLSLALGSGRLFHSASALLFVVCLIWLPKENLSAAAGSTHALAAMVVIVGLTVVVLNVFCGVLLDRKTREEPDLFSFWRWKDIWAMVHRPAFRVIVVKGAFFVCLAMSNILAPKFFRIGWLEFNAGAFAYALTFMFVDAIAETQGRTPSRQMWLAGVFTYFVVMLLVIAAVIPRGFNNELQIVFDGTFSGVVQDNKHVSFVTAFDATFFHGVLGFVIASLCSFTIAQYLDIWFFLLLKRVIGRQSLWIRNNITTFFAQTIDTAIFITVVSIWLAYNSKFVWPGWSILLSRVVGQLSVKWMFSLVYTP
ncbi:MAG TPA: queuosine precursor transporter, partial [Pyrinomonadaceae bacterium]|nr:queuosine precursor transporter [Pyrinomonadaceae bacterium]